MNVTINILVLYLSISGAAICGFFICALLSANKGDDDEL